MMIKIKGGRVIDPANGIDKVQDLYILNGKIASSESAKKNRSRVREIDAKGKIVCPGFIDLHVHLRQPGEEYKETVSTACDAAAAGGFTSVVAMPNTIPRTDNRSVVEAVQDWGARANGVNVFVMGNITVGGKGERLAEIGDMHQAGAVGFTDDGACMQNAAVMRAALEYSKNFDTVIAQHAEDMTLTASGQMHEGYHSTRLGLGGIPAESESIIVARDVHLAEMTGGRYHIQHISSKESVEMVRLAKKKGLHVTAEATPHHFTLSDASLGSYDSNYKMKPPLRSDEHIQAIRKGLKDGTIDAIATDHAPHAEIDKKVEFDQAAFGIIGLQTALSISLELVRDKVLSIPQLIARMTSGPASIIGVDRGTLSEGAIADVTIFDPKAKWDYKEENNRSKSKNSPWIGQTLQGKVVCTISDGKVIYEDEP